MERLEDLSPFRWIADNLDALDPEGARGLRGNLVSACVPAVFEAYCKILHPIYELPNQDHETPARNRGSILPNEMEDFARRIPEGARRVRWAELARRLGLVFHPEINEHSLGRSSPGTRHMHLVGPAKGTLDEGSCLRLAELLEPFVDGRTCYFQYDFIATEVLFSELLNSEPPDRCTPTA